MSIRNAYFLLCFVVLCCVGLSVNAAEPVYASGTVSLSLHGSWANKPGKTCISGMPSSFASATLAIQYLQTNCDGPGIAETDSYVFSASQQCKVTAGVQWRDSCPSGVARFSILASDGAWDAPVPFTKDDIIEPPPAECEQPDGQSRYQLVTDPPTLNYLPEPSYCQDLCRWDYVDSYFFNNGSIENHYQNSGALCNGEHPTPSPTLSILQTPPDPETRCYDVIGYVNGVQVCGDAKNECDAVGGAYGFINGQEVCIPQEENPPTCEARSVVIATSGSGYACALADTEPPPDPDEVDPNDWDGDGVDNASDSDDDGDGIPDNTDTDDNGDGSADLDSDADGTNDHDDEDDDGDGVTDDRDGSGQCDPESRGYASCIGQTESISDNADDRIEAEIRQDGSAAGDAIVKAGKDALGDGMSGVGEGEADGLKELIMDGLGLGEGGSCVDAAFTVRGQLMEYKCSETERIRIVMSYVFALLTIMSIFNIAIGRDPGYV